MKPMRRTRWILFLSLLCAVVGACSGERETSGGKQDEPGRSNAPKSPVHLRDVRVRLDWTPWAPHASLYAALDQGYFAQEGLRVSLYVPPDPDATTKLVAAGVDDFGISYMTDVILAREQQVPVVSVAQLVAHPLNCVMTLKRSGIDTPAKLKGKTIGTTGVPSDEAFLDWVLKRNGLSRANVRVVNLGFSLAPALKSGRVDAIVGAYWPWEGIRLEEEGNPVNVLKLQDYGVPDYYELVLVTRGDLLTREPEVVRGFLRALARGDDFVQRRPDQAVAILHRASPDLSTNFLSASMTAMLPLMRSPGGALRQDTRTWSTMVEFMRTAGLVRTAPSVQSLFTNEYLASINSP